MKNIRRFMLGMTSILWLQTTCTQMVNNKQKRDDTTPAVNDLGECGGCMVRLVAYDQKALFAQKEEGTYTCFELQERMDNLNREFEKKKADLRDRSRSLKMHEVDSNNPEHMGTALKEQSALEIDAKLLQQEFQMRMGQLQSDFLQEVQNVIRDLAAEFEWDVVLPIDTDVAFVVAKVDVTNKIVTRLNDKFRTKQRAKKFGDATKKESASKKVAQ